MSFTGKITSSFIFSDCNQSVDSPEHLKSWEELKNCDIEQDLSIPEAPLPKIDSEEMCNSTIIENTAGIPSLHAFDKLNHLTDINEFNLNSSASSSDKNYETISNPVCISASTTDYSVDEIRTNIQKLSIVNLPEINKNNYMQSESDENCINEPARQKDESPKISYSHETITKHFDNSAIKNDIEFDETKIPKVKETTCDIKACEFNASENCELEADSDNFSEFTDFTTGNVSVEPGTVQTLASSNIISASVSNQDEDNYDDFNDFEGVNFDPCNSNPEVMLVI